MLFVAFDLDGTLIDSVQDLATAASELATRLGGRALDRGEVAAMVGDGASLLVKRALAAAGVDPETPAALEEFLEIYDRRLLETTRPYPGVREALDLAAPRARMGVLTNKPARPTTRLLEAFDLMGYFEGVVGGDSLHGRKPDPSGLHALAGQTACVLLVGDSPIDWQTARSAGCFFGWARYGFGATRFDAGAPDTPFVLEQPSDLAWVIDRVTALGTGA
ncbi:MAG: HAD family hydrolase [Acidobacteriota bacterium]